MPTAMIIMVISVSLSEGPSLDDPAVPPQPFPIAPEGQVGGGVGLSAVAVVIVLAGELFEGLAVVVELAVCADTSTCNCRPRHETSIHHVKRAR